MASQLVRNSWFRGNALRKNRRGQTLLCEALEARQLLAVVTSLANSGAGTLREALAGTDPLITFAVSGTINLSTQLFIARNVTIDATGQTVTVNQTNTSQRVFTFTANNLTVTMKNLTMTNGNVPNTATSPSGGAIRVSSGSTLTIDRCVISGNIAREGGAIGLLGNAKLYVNNSTLINNEGRQAAGAIDVPSAAKATITSSTIESNKAGIGSTQTFLAIGGGVRVFGNATIRDSILRNNTAITPDKLGYGGAAGVTEGGSLTIENTEISGNTSDRGGGVSARGAQLTIRNSLFSANESVNNGGGVRAMRIPSDVGTVTIENSTFVGNKADGGGGVGASVYLSSETSTSEVTVTGSTFEKNDSKFDGGGIEQFGTNLSVTNSTFSANKTVNEGGGLWSSFDKTFKGSVIMNYVTFQGNKSDQNGGGIYSGEAPFQLRNSILSGNTAGTAVGNDLFDYQYASANPVDAKFTLVADSNGHSVTDGVMGNLVGNPANLGPLANNGGPTKTHMLNAGPGRNAADPASSLGTDQRGFLRPGANTQRDMGAVEADGTAPGLNLDFNNDGNYDCADMDLLEAAIDAGTPVAPFDVNGDNVLSAADVFEWLIDAGELRFGTGRFFRHGDADLNGTVNNADHQIWFNNRFTNARRWCQGDFNQDNFTDGGDFSIWNANKGLSSEGGRGAQHDLPVPKGQEVRIPSGGSRPRDGARPKLERMVPARPEDVLPVAPQRSQGTRTTPIASPAAFLNRSTLASQPVSVQRSEVLTMAPRPAKSEEPLAARTTTDRDRWAKERIFADFLADVF